MKISFYSELARQHIVRIREEIIQSSIGSSDDATRIFRTKMIGAGEYDHKVIADVSDFASLRELSDPLFYLQEHRFNLFEIKRLPATLSLKF